MNSKPLEVPQNLLKTLLPNETVLGILDISTDADITKNGCSSCLVMIGYLFFFIGGIVLNLIFQMLGFSGKPYLIITNQRIFCIRIEGNGLVALQDKIIFDAHSYKEKNIHWQYNLNEIETIKLTTKTFEYSLGNSQLFILPIASSKETIPQALIEFLQKSNYMVQL